MELYYILAIIDRSRVKELQDICDELKLSVVQHRSICCFMICSRQKRLL